MCFSSSIRLIPLDEKNQPSIHMLRSRSLTIGMALRDAIRLLTQTEPNCTSWTWNWCLAIICVAFTCAYKLMVCKEICIKHKQTSISDTAANLGYTLPTAEQSVQELQLRKANVMRRCKVQAPEIQRIGIFWSNKSTEDPHIRHALDVVKLGFWCGSLSRAVYIDRTFGTPSRWMFDHTAKCTLDYFVESATTVEPS